MNYSYISSQEDAKPDSQESLNIFSQDMVFSQQTNDIISDMMNQQDPVTAHPMYLEIPFDNTLLCNTPGLYGFQVGFHEENRFSKSCPWTYSKSLDKLYVGLNQLCPFLVSVSSVPADAFIRVALFYKKSEDSARVPIRCPTHASMADTSNFEHFYPSHLIRSEHKEAVYEMCANGRSCVRIPFRPIDSGSFSYNFKLMCRNSCEGGIGRRPTLIFLALENSQGEFLGGSCLEIRICSCPGRDRLDDERKEGMRHLNGETNVNEVSKDLKRALQSFSNLASGSGKRLKLHDTSDEQAKSFEIVVHDKRLYHIMEELKSVLEKRLLKK